MAKIFKGFTPDQQYTLLSKMGYAGPKDSEQMAQFIASSPRAAAKLGEFSKKAQERLNKKPVQMQEGGVVQQQQQELDAAQKAFADAQKAALAKPDDQAALRSLTNAQQQLAGAQTGFAATAVPSATEAVSQAITTPTALVTTPEVAKIEEKPDQVVSPEVGQVVKPPVVTPQQVVETAQAQAPEKTEAAKVEATTVTPQVETTLADVQAATAEPSKAATVAGQLETLMSQFEGGATPPWASGAMRQAMAVMQQRGLGASSVAGQAVVQAAMESAIAIASQDAATTAQFEMQNLNNEQQTTIFKTQQRIASLFTDQAAENASKQFNAASENQTNQFFAGLQESVSRFNADQVNAIRQFNAGQTNAIEQFNSQLQAQRDQFNAQNSLIIAQANAKWRQDIATLNTAAQNQANMEAAKTANGLTTNAMNQIWQRERDLMSMAWQSAENSEQRALDLLLANKKYSELEATRKDEEKTAMFALAGNLLFGGGLF